MNKYNKWLLQRTKAKLYNSSGISLSIKFFRQNYRDINFDTLRDRHDNFQFQKVLQTKNKIHDTMHFQGILDNPTTPKLILF